MNFARAPRELKQLALLALLFPALAVFETAVYRQIPYWKFEWSLFSHLVVGTGFLSLFLVVLLVRGSRITRPVYLILSGLWVALSLFRATQSTHNLYGAAVFGLLVWLTVYGYFLFKACAAPYIDSGQRWFEGAPTVMPHVSCELNTPQGKKGPYRVTRLTEDGTYLLGPLLSDLNRDPIEVLLQFKGKTFRTQALVMRERPMEDNKGSVSYGFGLQFKNTSLDLRKEIADFIELLRGEGYVS